MCYRTSRVLPRQGHYPSEGHSCSCCDVRTLPVVRLTCEGIIIEAELAPGTVVTGLVRSRVVVVPWSRRSTRLTYRR